MINSQGHACKRFSAALSCLLLSLFFSSSFVFADVLSPTSSAPSTRPTLHSYYTGKFYELHSAGVKKEKADPAALKNEINLILSGVHYPHEGQFDEVVPFKGNYLFAEHELECVSKGTCYVHKYYDYTQARKLIFGKLYLRGEESSGYSIKDVYCEDSYQSADFPSDRGPAPGSIPEPSVMNLEHTWPQSHFAGSLYPILMQKSDLHHLFPVYSKINSFRSNFPFGEVSTPVRKDYCEVSKLGSSTVSRQRVFEPPLSHKGNVARAIFYFSVKYKATISADEAAYLKKWNKLDPVDVDEIRANQEIYNVQNTRNPFVDYPELIDII